MRIWRSGLLSAGILLLLCSTARGATQEAKHFIVDVVAINGEEFTVKDETGKEGKIHVGSDTERYGHVQPGDRIDAWVFPNGHARTILILRSASAIQEDRKQADGRQRASAQPEEAQQAPR